nr:M23 family metallopeptidase [Nonomuraea sp. SBT364]
MVASADGTVVQSFFHDNGGNLVQIKHSGGWFTTSIHLDSRAVSKGDRVRAGQTIGKVGKTGVEANNHPHLHYEQAYSTGSTASWGGADTQRKTVTFNGTTYTGHSRTWRHVESRNCGSSGGGGASFSGDAQADLMVLNTAGDISARINQGRYFNGPCRQLTPVRSR